MRKDHFAYRIIVWHNDSVNGTHQATLCHAASLAKVLKDFEEYSQRAHKSYNNHNQIQLVGPDGMKFDIQH